MQPDSDCGAYLGPIIFSCQRGWEQRLQNQFRACAHSRFSKMMVKWFNASLHFGIGSVHFLDASWMAR